MNLSRLRIVACVLALGLAAGTAGAAGNWYVNGNQNWDPNAAGGNVFITGGFTLTLNATPIDANIFGRTLPESDANGTWTTGIVALSQTTTITGKLVDGNSLSFLALTPGQTLTVHGVYGGMGTRGSCSCITRVSGSTGLTVTGVSCGGAVTGNSGVLVASSLFTVTLASVMGGATAGAYGARVTAGMAVVSDVDPNGVATPFSYDGGTVQIANNEPVYIWNAAGTLVPFYPASMNTDPGVANVKLNTTYNYQSGTANKSGTYAGSGGGGLPPEQLTRAGRGESWAGMGEVCGGGASIIMSVLIFLQYRSLRRKSHA
jgi:hypothetical protein